MAILHPESLERKYFRKPCKRCGEMFERNSPGSKICPACYKYRSNDVRIRSANLGAHSLIRKIKRTKVRVR